MKGDESGDHDFASGGLHRIMLARKSMKTLGISNALTGIHLRSFDLAV
jgi:hypothetical protein